MYIEKTLEHFLMVAGKKRVSLCGKKCLTAHLTVFCFCSALVRNFMDAVGPSGGFSFHVQIRIFIILGLQCTALLQVRDSLMSIPQPSALTFPLHPLFTISSAHRRTGLHWTADSWGTPKSPLPPPKKAHYLRVANFCSLRTQPARIRRTPIRGLNCQSVLWFRSPPK